MSATDKITPKEIGIGIGLVAIFAVAMLFVLSSYRKEGEKRSATISEEGEKDPNHVEAFVKLLSVDPVKGDATARLEFIPHGTFTKDDGTLTQNLKLYINSANGKTEHEFQKGKRMNPVEAVINLYDGLVTDYPFDHHSGFLELYFTRVAAKPAEGGSTTAAKPAEAASATETPKPAAKSAEGEETAKSGEEAAKPASETPKPQEKAASDDDEDVPLAVDLFGSIAGYKIEAVKSAESEDDYVGIELKFSRSSTVVFFSVFVMALMWGVTLAVMFMTLSIFLRGRKIELAMFSFLAALLFAFAAVRNSQPGVPPIGTFSDFIAFFWAEVILALCLLAIIFMWLLRPAAK